MASALRVGHLWRKTLFDERCFGWLDRRVLVGPGQRVHFSTADVGLGQRLSIVRRGWLGGWFVDLDGWLAGDLCLDGQTRPLKEVRASIETDGKRRRRPPSVRLRPGDWGLLRVGSGDHVFYVQLAPRPTRLPIPVGRGTSSFLAAALWALTLHAILVGMTYIFDTWPPPGGSPLGGYVIKISHAAPPPPPEKKAGGAAGEKTPSTAAQAKEGKSGGKGEKPRQTTASRSPHPTHEEEVRKKVSGSGMLKYSSTFGEITRPDEGLERAMAHIGSPGYGRGQGTGVGSGTAGLGSSTRGGSGSGGGGHGLNDVVSRAPIDVGTGRAPRGAPGPAKIAETPVSVATGTPEGEFDGLTPEQVRAVVEKHRSALQYCFEKELQKNPKLNGKVVVYWRIDPSGSVTTSKVKSSTVGSADVEDCLVRQVRKWPFPAAANGQVTDVRYPFVFSGR